MNTFWESITDLNWGLIGAFGGAAFGQICSHFLTQNRDTKKEKRRTSKTFILPSHTK